MAQERDEKTAGLGTVRAAVVEFGVCTSTVEVAEESAAAEQGKTEAGKYAETPEQK